MLRALGKSPTEAEIKAIVKDIDPDNRGVVDYKEFEKIMTRDIRQYDNEQDLKAAWKVGCKPSVCVRVWGGGAEHRIGTWKQPRRLGVGGCVGLGVMKV